MTEFISTFDYPAAGWLQLHMNSSDGAERVAREVADRQGEESQDYAEAVYPELKAIWMGMRERQAAPVAVYVPHTPRSARPLVPASAYVQAQKISPAERTMVKINELVNQSQPDQFGEPEITFVQLPVGPACRLQEMQLDEGDDGRQFVIDHIDFYVLPPECPDGVFKLSVTWFSPAMGQEMTELADRMAASLAVERRGERAVDDRSR